MKSDSNQQIEKVMERALIVGVNINSDANFHISMSELESLAKALNMVVVGRVEQNLSQINKGLYIGTGKVVEVQEKAHELRADIVIFDHTLSPSQLRNLQDELQMPVMDRMAIILDIFSKRASSREAMIQVEVAKLQYFLPRLIGLREALSRQGGGSGSTSNKGLGEKKLELDRRKLEQRLTELKKELEQVAKERQTQRKRRSNSGIPRVALVGYTNSGKSTLMNAMVESFTEDESKKVLEKDMVFATLDTTVRKISPPNRTTMLLSDTVGFISRLPHKLVEAFLSTLEEAKEADVLLQVVDCSDEHYKEQIQVTNDTLSELGASDIPMIYVFNKAEKIMDISKLPVVKDGNIYMSAKQRIGLDQLLIQIEKKLANGLVECKMLLPYERGDIISRFKESGMIRSMEYLENGIQVELLCGIADYEQLKQFAQT